MSEIAGEIIKKGDEAGDITDEGYQMKTLSSRPGEEAPSGETIHPCEVKEAERFQEYFLEKSDAETLDGKIPLAPDGDETQEGPELKVESAKKEIPSIKVTSETFQEWFEKQADVSPILEDPVDEIHSTQSPTSPSQVELPECPTVSHRSAFARYRRLDPFLKTSQDDHSVLNLNKDPNPTAPSDFSEQGLSRSKSQPEAGPSDPQQKSRDNPKKVYPLKYYPLSGTELIKDPKHYSRPGTSRDYCSYPDREKARKESSPDSVMDTDSSDDEWTTSSKSSHAMSAATQKPLKRSDLYHLHESPYFEYHSYWDPAEGRMVKYRIPMNEKIYHESLQKNEKRFSTWKELTRRREKDSARNRVRSLGTPTDYSSDWDFDTDHVSPDCTCDKFTPIGNSEKNKPTKHDKATAECTLQKTKNPFSFTSSFAASDASKSQALFNPSRKTFDSKCDDAKKSEGKPLFGATSNLFTFGSQSVFGFKDFKKDGKSSESNEEESSIFGNKAKLEESEKKERLFDPKVSQPMEVSLASPEVQSDQEPFISNDGSKSEKTGNKDNEKKKNATCGESFEEPSLD